MKDFKMIPAREKGNAFVYILIAVALFAALTFVLARQEDTKETGVLDEKEAKLLANQLINTASQIKGALDQMTFAGTRPQDFDFTKPGESGFESDTLDKVFHPDGAGVVLQPLPANAVPDTAIADPGPGWYLGRFNHVEWTPSASQDVLLTAYGLKEGVCARINEVLTGSSNIPLLDAGLARYLVDASEHSGANVDLMKTNCPSGDCEDHSSLCVQNSGQNRFGFYNILIGE